MIYKNQDVSFLFGSSVFIRFYNSSQLFKATVIFRQASQEISPFDLAVLRCPEGTRSLLQQKVPKIVPALIGQF